MHWAIRLREDGTFIGVCDLSEIRHEESADVQILPQRILLGTSWLASVSRLWTSVSRRLLPPMGSLAPLRLKPHGINPVGESPRKTSEHIPLEMGTDVGTASPRRSGQVPVLSAKRRYRVRLNGADHQWGKDPLKEVVG
jgi:hypothetical protein